MEEISFLCMYQVLFILLFVLVRVIDRVGLQNRSYIFKHRPILQYNRASCSGVVRFINGAPIYIGVFLVAFLLFLFTCIFNMEYCDYLLKNINDIEQIVVAFVAISISVIIFFATLSTKKYNFSFNTKRILKKYKIYLSYNFMIISTIVSIICTFFLQE